MCKQSGRPNFKHFLSSCRFLPDDDRKFMSRTRLVCSADAENYSDTDEMLAPDERELDLELESRPPTRRVATRQSPYLKTFHRSHPVQLTIDSGAETNMISLRAAKYLKADIDKSSLKSRDRSTVLLLWTS